MTDNSYFAVVSLVWVFYSSWWIFSTWYINVRHAQPLHRIITFFLVFKSLNCIFTLISFSFCLEGQACYWDLAVNSTYTIYNTFLYTQILLISKGFNIIKEYLTRNELTFVAMGMGCIYLGFSCYSIQKPNFILMLALILSGAFCSFIKFSLQNMQKLSLKRQLFVLHSNFSMVQITQQKISLFTRFLKLVSFMLIGKIMYLGLKWLQLKRKVRYNLQSLEIADDILEVLTASAITYLVRAKVRGYLYDLHSDQMDRELRPLNHFLKARVPKGFQVEVSPRLPFLVMTPKGRSSPTSENLLVANPV